MPKRSIVCTLFILMFLSGILSSFGVELAKADDIIYIKADGSIIPTDSPISTTDNITYTLTGNISSSSFGIMVQRNNTIIDGNGYTLQGSWNRDGIFMTNVSNVMVRNMNIGNFDWGIEVYFSSNITLCDNNFNHTSVGTDLYFSFDNIIFNNNFTSCRYGIGLDSSSAGNILSGNNITRCRCGIILYYSSNNSVIQNSFTENYVNIDLDSPYSPASSTFGNRFFHNNFSLRTYPSFQIGGYDYQTQTWDNGFEGNCWSDYNGKDNNEDGIGDTPYVIDPNNIDHYPLMGTFQSFNVSMTPQSFEEVDIVSNSTIEKAEFILHAEDPQYPWGLVLTVQGQNGTTGFCRITFQNDLLNSSSYLVYIYGYPTPNRIVESNGTHTTLYFTYNQFFSFSDFGIFILPEFPPFLILPLFMIATLLAIIVCKRRHQT